MSVARPRRRGRIGLAIALVTLAHAALCLALLYGAALAALARIDTGTPPTGAERALGLATTVLWYPVAGPILSADWARPSGLWAYLLLVLNRLLWATLIVLAARALRARRIRTREDA